ncbi:MAG TPA: thiamine-phosphate kinase [Longimicrobiales bacterium]|nr:thiamine-phosphate kinase [Longimicrobiales bacterium]
MRLVDDRDADAEASEFDLIRAVLGSRTITAPLLRVDAGDDCAVFAPAPLAIGNDLSVEGTHFLRDWITLAEVGWRAGAAALSDLAAMAAEPAAVLLGLCLDPGTNSEGALAIARGVIDAAEATGAGLAGGDVSRGPVLALDVVAIGRCDAPRTRAGARAGDALWVTGRLGAAATAVRAWREGGEPSERARAAFASPRPRVQEALWLAGRGASAMIDVSDGLSSDAAHLADASGLAAVLDAARIPVAEDAGARLEDALHGGEDYELLVALPAASGGVDTAAFEARFGIPLTRIGVVRPGAGAYLRDADGESRPLPRGGFDHLGGTTA